VNEKNYFRVITLIFLAVFVLGGAIGAVTAIAVYGHLRPDRPAGGEPETAIGINREITDSERRGLDQNREAIRAVEELRTRNQEADRALGELGIINNGSGDLLQVLRKKVEILEDYFRDTGGIIGRLGDSDRSE